MFEEAWMSFWIYIYFYIHFDPFLQIVYISAHIIFFNIGHNKCEPLWNAGPLTSFKLIVYDLSYKTFFYTL